jgi:uncharacterized phage-associated protein
MSSASSAKSLSVAQYLLDCCHQAGDVAVTPMQLIKLAYVAHGYMLGRHGRPLLDEPVQAWQYGPVVPSVYRAVKGYQSAPVPAVPGAPRDTATAFSPEEQAVMKTVAQMYGKYSGVVLSSATHKAGTPWQRTWELAGKNAPISNDLIESFYAGILRQPTHSSL